MKPIRVFKTIYPPKPYLMFNEWMEFINKSVNKKKGVQNEIKKHQIKGDAENQRVGLNIKKAKQNV
tara:strand:+ start:956 stop:1153 length:198 start_codon:yes stop_codon:yes gene_type:complete